MYKVSAAPMTRDYGYRMGIYIYIYTYMYIADVVMAEKLWNYFEGMNIH